MKPPTHQALCWQPGEEHSTSGFPGKFKTGDGHHCAQSWGCAQRALAPKIRECPLLGEANDGTEVTLVLRVRGNFPSKKNVGHLREERVQEEDWK